MKTTKKWSKILLAGMAAMVLAFGLVLVGCDDGNGGGDDGNPFKGTWNGSAGQTIALSDTVFTWTWTTITVKGTYTYTGNTAQVVITESGYTGYNVGDSFAISIANGKITFAGYEYTKQ